MLILFVRGWGVSVNDMMPLELELAKTLAFDSVHLSASELMLNQLSAGQQEALVSDTQKVIIGWSLGGTYVLEHFHHFQAVSALILLSTPPALLQTERFPEGWPPKILHRMLSKLTVAPEHVLADFRHRLTYTALEGPNERMQPSVADFVKTTDCSPAALQALSEIELDCDRVMRHCEHTRTLIVHGAEDLIVRPESMSALRSCLPQAEVRLIERCGHSPHLEAVATVSKEICQFICREGHDHD